MSTIFTKKNLTEIEKLTSYIFNHLNKLFPNDVFCQPIYNQEKEEQFIVELMPAYINHLKIYIYIGKYSFIEFGHIPSKIKYQIMFDNISDFKDLNINLYEDNNNSILNIFNTKLYFKKGTTLLHREDGAAIDGIEKHYFLNGETAPEEKVYLIKNKLMILE